MPQNRFTKHPKLTLALILTIILIILALGFETYLALTKPDLLTKQGIKRSVRLSEYAPLSTHSSTPSDAWMMRTDSLLKKDYRWQIDEDGFIYPSRVHDDPDLKIVFLGGSTTECVYVDEKNKWPYLVGRLLENKHGKVNSYNSGVIGDNSLQLINILLNKIIPVNPDIVVMMETLNDLTILMYEGDYWNSNPYKSTFLYKPKETFFSSFRGLLKSLKDLLIPNLYQRISSVLIKEGIIDEFAGVRGKKIINKDYLIKKYKKNLQMFISICRSNGIVPVLMTQASRFKEKPDAVIIKHVLSIEKDFGISYSQLRELFNAFNETVRTVGESNSVLVIDLAAKVPQEREYMYDYNHYNDKGSRFVAKIIASELTGSKLITLNKLRTPMNDHAH